MSLPLAFFQDAFIAMLYDRRSDTLDVLADQPGFAVYRNGIISSCMQAICDNYPAVESLVGREWLRAAARVYVRETPPGDVSLIHYGACFPDFLARFGPARDLPYLPAVAHLDRLWIEAYTAEFRPPLQLAALAQLPASTLGELHFRPSHSARWHWFEDCPAYSIWRSNREGQATNGELHWQAEGALLVGDEERVASFPLSLGGIAMLDAFAQGHTLNAAAASACEAEPSIDFTWLLGSLLNAGALASLSTP